MSRTFRLTTACLVVALIGGLGWGLFNVLKTGSQDNHIDEGILDPSTASGSNTPRRADAASSAGTGAVAVTDHAGPDGPGLTPSGKLDAFGYPLALLRFVVVDHNKNPVVDVELELVVDHGSATRGSIEAETVAIGQTDTDGVFVFSDVPSFERYIVIARHESHATLHRGGVQLASGEGRELVLQLAPGRTVWGAVADSGGRPIPGAVVTVYDISRMVLDEERHIERRAVTDSEGRYVLAAIARGFKNIVATADGHADGVYSSIDFSRGQQERALDFKLARGGEISGRVLSDRGDPVSGAIVSIQAVRLEDGRSDYHHPVRTDDGGRFLIGGLTDGMSFLVSARRGGFAGRLARKNVATGDTDIVLTLLASLRIRGRVVNDDTGAPVTAFSLLLSPSPQLRRLSRQFVQRVFNEDGRFDFYAPSTTGVRRFTHLFALVPGTAGASQRVVLVPDDRPRARPLILIEGVELRVRKGAVITGRIVDAKGKGIRDARIELLPDSKNDAGATRRAIFEKTLRRRFAQARNETWSLPDGSFEMAGVMQGEWRLRVIHDVFASMIGSETITIVSEQSVDAGQLVMGQGGHVWGRVRDNDHKPEEGAVVNLVPVPGEAGYPMQHRTDLTGVFDFRGVRPGVYHLSVTERKGISTYRSLLASGQSAAVAASGAGRRIVVDEGSEIEQDFD